MSEENLANERIRAHEHTTPVFVYELGDYPPEKVRTLAPVHVGDVMTVRLGNDQVLHEMRVKAVKHFPGDAAESAAMLGSYIYFERERA